MTKNKILKLIITLLLMVVLIPMVSIKSYAYEQIEGTEGKGTEGDPILVNTYDELRAALALDTTVPVYIRLSGDITSNDKNNDYQLVVSKGKKILDLYGRAITRDATTVDRYMFDVSGGELHIKDSNFWAGTGVINARNYKANYIGILSCSSGGTVYIGDPYGNNNIVFNAKSSYYTAGTQHADIYISGKCVMYDKVIINSDAMSFEAAKGANVEIYGGTFTMGLKCNDGVTGTVKKATIPGSYYISNTSACLRLPPNLLASDSKVYAYSGGEKKEEITDSIKSANGSIFTLHTLIIETSSPYVPPVAEKIIPGAVTVSPQEAYVGLTIESELLRDARYLGAEHLKYFWQRTDSYSKDGSASKIPGATSSTYTATNDDKGRYVRVCVSAEGYVDMLISEWVYITDPPKTRVYSGKCGDNASFEFDSETGVLTISGTGAIYDYNRDSSYWEVYADEVKKVVIEKGITSIGSHAFYNCKNLKTADIPVSLTKIERGAFDYTGLKLINFGASKDIWELVEVVTTAYSNDTVISAEKKFEDSIKGICQMPYGMVEPGQSGYLIGIQTIESSKAVTVEMLILDCTTMQWVYSTGKNPVNAANEFCCWTVWQPQYGYYWTLYRAYDKDGYMIDQKCYGFENI